MLARRHGSGEFVAQGPVAPPGDGRGSGQVGLAQDGCVGAPLEADGDGVAVVDDRAWGFQEAALEGVGSGGGVAGQPGAQGGQQAWASTASMTSRSTLRLTVLDRASAQKARMISARRCSMVMRRA